MRTEWKLNEFYFSSITNHFKFTPNVDLFASRLNTQLTRFFSYIPDPKAELVNAFTVDWSNIDFYCFPPFSCINKVVQKIIADNATGILVVPAWPNQIWYPVLQDILLQTPMQLPPQENLVYLPSQPEFVHPFFRDLRLMACLVSGKCSRSVASHQGQQS